MFNVRCGTKEGVVTHHLRTETHRDLAAWARALVQGAHQAVFTQREIICRKLSPSRYIKEVTRAIKPNPMFKETHSYLVCLYLGKIGRLYTAGCNFL